MHEQRRTHAINRDTTTYNQGIHRWCRRLYAFVYWKDVTQTILTKKTLRFCFYLPIGSDHAQANFAGTAHTKATLMGLLTYFPPSLSFVSHGVQIHGVDFLIQLVKRIVDVQNSVIQATLEKAIAIRIKCCWCCRRLANPLGDIKPPGHILVFLLGWGLTLLLSRLLRMICGVK